MRPNEAADMLKDGVTQHEICLHKESEVDRSMNVVITIIQKQMKKVTQKSTNTEYVSDRTLLYCLIHRVTP